MSFLMLRTAITGAVALLLSVPAHAETTMSQRIVLDDVAAAMVAGEKCPGLRFNQTAAAVVITGARMSVSDPNVKDLLGGRVFGSRAVWDLDKDPRACERAAQNRILLERR
jgi:hypothetical protein